MSATCAALGCGTILMHARGRPQEVAQPPAALAHKKSSRSSSAGPRTASKWPPLPASCAQRSPSTPVSASARSATKTIRCWRTLTGSACSACPSSAAPRAKASSVTHSATQPPTACTRRRHRTSPPSSPGRTSSASTTFALRSRPLPSQMLFWPRQSDTLTAKESRNAHRPGRYPEALTLLALIALLLHRAGPEHREPIRALSNN